MKINQVILYGRVAKEPNISKSDPDSGQNKFLGVMYLDVCRGRRTVGDGISYTKHDSVMVTTFDEEYVCQMEQCHKNDIVLVKGVLTSGKVKKAAPCPICQETGGAGAKEIAEGIIVYVTPQHIKIVASYDEKIPAKTDIAENKEISNLVMLSGTLLKDPKLIKTKAGLQITQYPLISNRKYKIRMDDPDTKTDYLIVKSYGEQAIDDKTFLKFQSEIQIDGFLQTRVVTRRRKCPCCGEFYSWRDNSSEVVPYSVEHIKNVRTEEEIEELTKMNIEMYKNRLLETDSSDALEEDLMSEDVAGNN